jgi:aspartate/methionine/tyrosine aminotransferase
MLLDVSPYGLDGAAASKRLMERGQIAATAMVNWGSPRAADFVRFVFANEPLERLRGIGARVAAALR